MPDAAVYIILFTMAAYLAAGVLFAMVFQVEGIELIDEGVHGSTIGFRIIIIPGCILLWPVLWRKWIKSAAAKRQKKDDPPHLP